VIAVAVELWRTTDDTFTLTGWGLVLLLLALVIIAPKS
jgi:hypothetical protein